MILPCLFLLAGLAQADGVAEDEGLPLLDYEALSRAVAELAAEHAELVTPIAIGTSREGRRIEALQIAAPGHAPDWPAILLVANLEGPRVFDTAVALHHARRLAEDFTAGEESVRRLLADTVVYVLPCANPDAAEARFAEPRHERRTGGRGVDDDRDGREGEDAPADVDGDGLVTSMRVPDPDGTWMADPSDPRALVEADPKKGQRGVWKVYTEGRDSDGDERVAEDAPSDTRLNRNFPSGWREHAPDAGLFPADEPEARALIEFVLQRENVALVLTYGAQDNLVGKPQSVKDDARPVKRVPPPGVLESDAELIGEIGARYRELTGSEHEGTGSDEGSFQRWCYDHRGLFTLNAVLWSLPEEDLKKPEEPAEPDAAPDGDESEGEAVAEEPQEAPGAEAPEAKAAEAKAAKAEAKVEPSDDAKHLAWIDANGEAWRFDDWTTFQHPELGEVEIGGFAPFARVEPPASARRAIAEAQWSFLLELGRFLPRVRIAELAAEPLGAGVWRVEAVVENDALLPLRSRSARRTRTIRPARVRLLLSGSGRLLSGRSRELVDELGGSGARRELAWLVQGPEGMEVVVTVDSDNAGSDRASVEVAR